MKNFVLTFLLSTATCFAADPTITATVIRNGTPIKDSMVVLQFFENRDCVNLFNSKHPKPETAQKLKSCSRDFDPQYTDANGVVRFSDLKPGWYAVRVLFLYEPAPSAYRTACQYEEMALMLSSDRDTTGKYNAMAQRYPFELKASDARTLEFRFDKPIGANGKCLSSR